MLQPPPILPMMHPNQVEIISKEKRRDDPVFVNSDKNVVAITPKSVSKTFLARSAKSSPRGKRGNILMFFLAYYSAFSMLDSLWNVE